MTAIPTDVLQFLEMAGPTCEVAFSEEMAKIASKATALGDATRQFLRQNARQNRTVYTAQEGFGRLLQDQQQVGRLGPFYQIGGDVTRVTKKRKRDATGTFATPRSTLVPAETGTFATARPTLVPESAPRKRPRINLEGITPPQPSTATPSARQTSATVEKSAPSGPARVNLENLGRDLREPAPSVDALITRVTQTGARAGQGYPGSVAEQIAAIRQAGIASDAAGPVGTPRRVLEDLAAEPGAAPTPATGAGTSRARKAPAESTPPRSTTSGTGDRSRNTLFDYDPDRGDLKVDVNALRNTMSRNDYDEIIGDIDDLQNIVDARDFYRQRGEVEFADGYEKDIVYGAELLQDKIDRAIARAAGSGPTPTSRSSPEARPTSGTVREAGPASAAVNTADDRAEELADLLRDPNISGQQRADAQAELRQLMDREPRPRRAAAGAEATPASRPTPSPEPAGAAEAGGSNATYTFDDAPASTGPRSADQEEALRQGAAATGASSTTGVRKPVSESATSPRSADTRPSDRATAPSDRATAPSDRATAPSSRETAAGPAPSGPSTPGGAAEAPSGVNPRRFEEIRERLAEMFPASTVNNIMGIAAGMGTAGVKKLSDAANLLRTNPEEAIRRIADPVTGILAESASTANKINLTFQGMRVGVTGKSVQMIDSFRADSLRLKNIDDQIRAEFSQVEEARKVLDDRNKSAILGFGKKYEDREVQRAEDQLRTASSKITKLQSQRNGITNSMKSQIDGLPEGFNQSERDGLQKIVDDLSSDTANVDEVISRLSSDDIYRSLGGQPLPVEQINMIRQIMGDVMPPPGVSEQADEAAEGLAAALGKEIDPAYLAAAAGTGLAAGFMLGGD